jgi:hypothetical protein
LWIDQPDAKDILRRKLDEGVLSGAEAQALEHFIDYGYLVIDLQLPPEATVEFDRFLAEIWSERPSNCLAKHDTINGGVPTPVSSFPDNWVALETGLPKLTGTKILEAHSHSEMLRSINSHPALHRVVELIIEDVAVSTQSLLFSQGSEQALHRDPWFVPTNPASTMLASWVAIEDIDADSGPLAFIPGSHRVPWTLLDTGDILFAASSAQSKKEHMEQLMREIELRGLKKHHFTPVRGQAILWHAGLVHGGSEVRNRTLTRKSYVVHYDKLRNHPSKGTGYKANHTTTKFHSTKKIQKYRCTYAFPDPMVVDIAK